jgi:hypothetical protein
LVALAAGPGILIPSQGSERKEGGWPGHPPDRPLKLPADSQVPAWRRTRAAPARGGGDPVSLESAADRPSATGQGRPGYRLQATGYRPQATGHRPQATGHRLQATGHRPQATGHRLQATVRYVVCHL